MKIFFFALGLLITTIGFSQYEFDHTIDLQCTPIKNQARTGTCWSFATSSFMESELMRMGKGEHDLSEMFVVRNIYMDKAKNYVLRQGKANFSQGSLSHDLIAIIKKGGVVPESVYSGLLEGEKAYDHSEMEAGMKGFLDGVIKSKKPSKKWKAALNSILDTYMGEVPTKFEYNGKSHSSESLADELSINPDDYLNFTSFTHHPFDASFILEIPDNYSNGSFMNIPLERMMALIDKALENGYSVAWDGDVSEKGFNSKKGIAVLPKVPGRKDLFEKPGAEVKVTQALRQDNFENFSTTDDHLMHIVGKANDQDGNDYYITKNSWGAANEFKGYLYMSRAYVEMKTVSVMMHKDVLYK